VQAVKQPHPSYCAELGVKLTLNHFNCWRLMNSYESAGSTSERD